MRRTGGCRPKRRTRRRPCGESKSPLTHLVNTGRYGRRAYRLPFHLLCSMLNEDSYIGHGGIFYNVLAVRTESKHAPKPVLSFRLLL